MTFPKWLQLPAEPGMWKRLFSAKCSLHFHLSYAHTKTFILPPNYTRSCLLLKMELNSFKKEIAWNFGESIEVISNTWKNLGKWWKKGDVRRKKIILLKTGLLPFFRSTVFMALNPSGCLTAPLEARTFNMRITNPYHMAASKCQKLISCRRSSKHNKGKEFSIYASAQLLYSSADLNLPSSHSILL